LIILDLIKSPRFLEYRNLANVIRQLSIQGVLAGGETFVILSDGINEIMLYFLKISKEKKTVVLVGQNVRKALKISQWEYVLKVVK